MSEGERVPAEVYSLAEFICDEMLARGWMTKDAALRMGWTTEYELGIDCLALNLLLAVQDDGLIIGDEQFKKLACAFNVPEELFRDLDAAWKEWPDRRAIFVCPEHLLSDYIPFTPT